MAKTDIKLVTHDGIQELVIVERSSDKADVTLGKVKITKDLARWLVRSLADRII